MRPWAKKPFATRLPRGHCLRPESARQILHAERFAYALKRNLNVALTIVFNSPPCDPKTRAYDIFRTRIWANIRRQWNYWNKRTGRKKSFIAIAVFENPPNKQFGRRIFGPLHVHMILEWPERRFNLLGYYVRKTMRKYFVNFRPQHVHLQPVDYAAGFASYLAKGIDPPFADHFYVTHINQGPIYHRRIIISHSLGTTARNAFRAAGGNPLPNRRLLRRSRGKRC